LPVIVGKEGVYKGIRHMTKKLEILLKASDEFWELYDKDDPSTAPTNQDMYFILLC